MVAAAMSGGFYLAPVPAAWAAEESAALEEIIVTARRREETLQEVPAAISVFNDEQIFYSGNDSMDRLRNAIPNFEFASDMAYRSRTAVRGLGSDRSGIQTNGVGFFIDGVYQTGQARFNAPFFDVERVEVLKGPQGARYGRNSFAGVVNVVTRKPNNEFRVTAQAAAESEDGYEGALMISGPIIEDKLYAKLSVAHNESDGDYQHDITGEDILDLNSDFYALRLVWDVTERLELDFNAAKSDNDGVAFSFAVTDGLQDLSETFLLRDDQTSGSDYEEANLTATWDGDDVVVMNRVYYVDEFRHLRVDGDVTPFDGILSIVQADVEIWGDELRIQSAGDGPFHWLVGGEYYNAESFAFFPTAFLSEIGAALGSPILQFLDGVVSTNVVDGETDVWSVFGEVSIEFAERWELTLSARYDDIESSVFNAAAGTAGSGGLGAEFADDAIQPLVSLRYSIDDYTSVYASAARGIRQGGFNSSALTKDYAIFESDDVWSYEVGLKKQFPEAGAHLNLSAFYMDADTLNQAAIIVTDAGNLANGALTMGGADSYGVEMDLGVTLGGGVDWSFNMGILDCTYKNIPPFEERTPDFQQIGPFVKDGNTCQDSAEWTFNTALHGEWSLGGSGWMALATVTVSGKGDTRMTTDSGVPGRAGPLAPNPPEERALRARRVDEEIREPIYLVDLTFGIRNENWTILGYAENLFDKVYALDHFHHEGLCDSGICGLGAGKFITTLAPQRRLGLKIRYDF